MTDSPWDLRHDPFCLICWLMLVHKHEDLACSFMPQKGLMAHERRLHLHFATSGCSNINTYRRAGAVCVVGVGEDCC